jgi:hypothetical protein
MKVGDRALFRISGLYEYRIIAGRDDQGKHGLANSERLERAKTELQASGWDDYCVHPRSELSQSGIAGYLTATKGRRTRLSLYSALVIILMLEDFLREKGQPIDIYIGAPGTIRPAPIRILPYVFDVPAATGGVSGAAYLAALGQGKAIKTASGQLSLEFLAPMFSDTAVFSERTSYAVHDACGMSCGLDVIWESRPPCDHDKPVYPA